MVADSPRIAMRLVLALLLVAPLAASGQGGTSGTGRIVGVVTDAETGEPLPHASVLIVGMTTGTMADVGGRFALDVPEGTYTVHVSYAGYANVEIVEIQVEDGRAVELQPVLVSEILCECVITFSEPEAVSRGIYHARVVRYFQWESSCCTAWLERRDVALVHWGRR